MKKHVKACATLLVAFSLFLGASGTYQAKADEKQLETLIKDHKNFILANAYKMTGHYVTENDDEWSVGLIAFHEAVRTFDEGKGDFHAFAALVIKRRIYSPSIPSSMESRVGSP